VAAAKGAGLFCVAVPNPMTRPLPIDHADLRLESLADVALDHLITAATVGVGEYRS
jgi:beta-phosphoglucomutase-like phosphatase (HAD superfamily)